MIRINESIGSFLDALAAELQRLLTAADSAGAPGQTSVAWTRDQPSAIPDGASLIWWSCSLSVDPACRLYAGADAKTWKEIADAGPDAEPSSSDDPQDTWFKLLTQSLERAAKTRFGAMVSCTELGVSEDAPRAWPQVSATVDRGRIFGPGAMLWVLSPELATALGGEEEPLPQRPSKAAPLSPLDMLQHVEMPVSVSFGRTHMRLKDLLALGNGSVVHLDRELGDEVEIRVNNCVIARGEVVAVDGNYGVRIVKMVASEAAGPTGQGPRPAYAPGESRKAV